VLTPPKLSAVLGLLMIHCCTYQHRPLAMTAQNPVLHWLAFSRSGERNRKQNQ
jgi:hypothetical protein